MADKNEHTPGPWRTIQFRETPLWHGVQVGTEGSFRVEGDNAEANARLIAAAPDLMDALRGLLEIGKRDLSNPKYDGYFDAARAAVAKAGG